MPSCCFLLAFSYYADKQRSFHCFHCIVAESPSQHLLRCAEQHGVRGDSIGLIPGSEEDMPVHGTGSRSDQASVREQIGDLQALALKHADRLHVLG